MKRIVLGIGRALGTAGRATVALIGISTLAAIAANYAVTVGSGTTFGSVVVGGVNYAQQLICDLTTPSQCASVSAGGAVKVDGSAVTQPVSGTVTATISGVATAANQATEIASLATIASNTGAAIPAGTATIGTVGQLPYPVGSTPYTATATGTTGATTATLAGASSVTTYLCGFSIRANATAAATGNATVTGVITATLNFTQWTAPNASGLGVTEEIFSPCIPASGTNQSVAVVSAAPGTGGVVSVTAWGYKL